MQTLCADSSLLRKYLANTCISACVQAFAFLLLCKSLLIPILKPLIDCQAKP